MRKFVYAFAIAAVSGLTAFAASGSAAPAVGGLALGGAVPLVDGDGLVHKVHGWHCSKKKGPYAGYKKRWHRHPKACRDRYEDDYGYDDGYAYYDGYYPYDDYGYYPYRRSYAYYPYQRNYGYNAYPFFSFGFGNRGGHRGKHHGGGDDD